MVFLTYNVKEIKKRSTLKNIALFYEFIEVTIKH